VTDGNGPSWPVRIVLLALPVVAAALLVGLRNPPPPAERRVLAAFDGRVYDLAVADTESTRLRGLQNHAEPQRAHGMLFVFDKPQEVTMAMKQLGYPIDVAFVGPSLRVVRTVSLQPQPMGIQLAPSGVPVRFVVELRAGSLIGDRVTVGSAFALMGPVR
jgi:uncharacterized membrane protein (UPF0127 family)